MYSMTFLKNNWRYLVVFVCLVVLASCSGFGEALHKSKLAVLKEDTAPVVQQRWDNDGKTYEVTEPLKKGSVVIPNPFKE